VYQLVDSFLSTEGGKEYLAEIRNFRSQAEDVSLSRFSQTLPIFLLSSKQLTQLSAPHFRVGPKYVQSPVRTHIDETRSSSIGLSASPLCLPPPEPMSPSRDQDRLASVDSDCDSDHLPPSLSSLYQGVHESVVWSILNRFSEPVMILTGQPPFFILKCSVDWHALMGYSAEEIFGKCIEHFISAEDLLVNPHLNQIKTPRPPRDSAKYERRSLESESTTYDSLMSFYQQLQPQQSPRRSHHPHIVLRLRTADQRVVPFSVHAFPLLRRQERQLGSDSVNGLSSQLKSLVNGSQERAGGEDIDRGPPLVRSESPAVAYHVLYMHQLRYLHPQRKEQERSDLSDEESERGQSMMDRMLSVASSTVSANVRKSWMGPTEAINQLPGPPQLEEGEEEEGSHWFGGSL
jgi:hypothetical protein